MEPKVKIPVPVPQFKKPPFFKSGTLVFQQSGHGLTLSDKYYRCILDCKQECNINDEKQIKKETLERAFSRLATEFKLSQKATDSFGPKVIKEMLCRIIMDEDDLIYFDESLDATFSVMREEFMGIETMEDREIFDKTHKPLKEGQISEKIISDFEESFANKAKKKYRFWLFGCVLSTLRAFSNPKNNEADCGYTLAYLCRRISLANDGKIIGLELERWGWYILNFIDRKIPNYLYKLAQKGIKITNKEDKLLSLDLYDAIKFFDGDETDALHNHEFSLIPKYFFEVRKFVDMIADGDDKKMRQEMLAFYASFMTNPVFAFGVESSPMLAKKIIAV